MRYLWLVSSIIWMVNTILRTVDGQDIEQYGITMLLSFVCIAISYVIETLEKVKDK